MDVDALLSVFLSHHLRLSAQQLIDVDDVALFRFLPIVMTAIQRAAPSSENGRSEFLHQLRIFRARLSACRWLKLRFLLLANHPAFASFWSLHLIHRANAYEVARKVLSRLADSSPANLTFDGITFEASRNRYLKSAPDALQNSESNSLIRKNATRPLNRVQFNPNDMKDPSLIQGFALHNLFARVGGIRTNTVTYNNQSVRSAFVASNLLNEIQHRSSLTRRSDAIKIAQCLLDIGLIHAVSTQSQNFIDSKRAIYHYRNPYDRDDDASRFSQVSSDAIDLRSFGGTSTSSGEKEIRRVEMRIPMDMMDLQSFDFWTKGVYLKKPKPGFRYNFCSVTHPLCSVSLLQRRLHEQSSTKSTLESPNSSANFEPQGFSHEVADYNAGNTLSDTPQKVPPVELCVSDTIDSVIVRKVFSSIAHPMIIELRQTTEDSDISDDDRYLEMPPPILVKSGDNLMQDLGVQLMFRCFNYLWKHDPSIREKHGTVPVCVGYEVFPTSTCEGFMEAVTDLKSLRDFDWEEWRRSSGGIEGNRNEMLRSTVGSYIGTYILGGRDRHFDNVLVQSGMCLLHIDFSYVLGSKPPVDGPAMSIAPAMEAAFRAVGIWDTFVKLSVDAFLVLRNHIDVLIRIAQMLFTKAGHTDASIKDFLSGRSSLNRHDDQTRAADHVKRQILRSSGDMGNWFKEFTHERVVPAWYTLLNKGFPPAKVLMKLRDAQERGAADRLAASLQDDSPVSADEKLNIE